MYFKVITTDNGTVIEIGDEYSDETFTLQGLSKLIQSAYNQEERARNIIVRRNIPYNREKESAVHACLSHLDNLR